MENQIEIINENQRDVELLEKKIKINLQKLFTPEGMDLIIKKIENEVANFEANIATKEGRFELAQLKKEKAEREKKDAEEKKERDEILIEKRKIEIQNIISQDLFSYLSYERKIEIVSFKFLSEPDENKWQEALKLIAFERDEIIKKREIAQKEAEEQAEKKAKKAIEDAVEKQRQRFAEIARKEAQENEKREANKRHRNKIEKEIFEKLKEILQVENNLFQTESDENLIKKILEAISKNQIPNLTINY